MFGIILWASKRKGTALVWCEDQGQVAFVPSPDVIVGQTGFCSVGDQVWVKLRTEGRTRYCTSLAVVDHTGSFDLPGALRDSACQSEAANRPATTSSKLVEFSRAAAARLRIAS